MYPLDSLSFDLKPYAVKQSWVYTALKNRSFFKLICNSSYRTIEEIEEYSEIFAYAGAHIINVSTNPAAVKAAKRGIDKANIGTEEQPRIMVSVSLDKTMDPYYNSQNLDNWVVSDEHFSQGASNARVENRGLCHENFSLEVDALAELWNLGASYLEIHAGNNFSWLEFYIRKIKEISPHPWMISIALSSQTSSLMEITRQAAEIHDLLGDGVLVQVNGSSISGERTSGNEHLAMLRSIVASGAVLEADKPVFVQVAGAANDSIRSLLSRFGVKVHGVGMGHYPRRLIDPYLKDDRDIAIKIATKLVQGAQSF